MAEGSGGRDRQQRLPWLVATTAAGAAGALLAVGLWGAVGGARPAAAEPRVRASGVEAVTVSSTTAPTAEEPPAPRSVTGGATARDAPVTDPGPSGAAVPGSGQPAVGDCLGGEVAAAATGAAGPQADVAPVDCAAPHRFEVVGLVEAPAPFRSRPTDTEWRSLLELRCPDLLRARIGGTYDPYGIVTLRISAPTAAEWAGGDRTGECLGSIGDDEGGRPRLFSGPLAGVDQSPPLAAGTCVDITSRPGAPRPVACDEPHQLRVTGPFEVTDRPAHYPDGEAWATFDRACSERAVAVHGVALRAPSGNPLVPAAVRIPVASWLAGRRDTACAVAEMGPDGRVVTRAGDGGAAPGGASGD